eukprot:CAMPEP_0175152486 /NCGR_PEP_ID=MMETSP0087-20121206/19137_1 /TAXON_ID=136419 /ORGANISM="Unknown Unknown, Strain D1" /LENGTH=160 /DNA_ID=CAMNT_0016438917 /DNA_START=21 /DNA_END=500 /DNA_ORIENTATION=+
MGKVSNYGAPFRAGDTVAVLVDMTNKGDGLVEFFLNGKSQGVAMSGLRVPVYIAVSLACPPIQVTMTPVRCSVAVQVMQDRADRADRWRRLRLAQFVQRQRRLASLNPSLLNSWDTASLAALRPGQQQCSLHSALLPADKGQASQRLGTEAGAAAAAAAA